MKVLRSIQRVPKGVKISLKINPMNKIINKLGVNKLALLLSLFCFFIYFITSPGNTSYNYFTRLADAFLNQRYYLTEGPPWLNELIPIGNDRFFVAYAPMPAIVAIPFVAFFIIYPLPKTDNKCTIWRSICGCMVFIGHIKYRIIPALFIYINSIYSQYFKQDKA